MRKLSSLAHGGLDKRRGDWGGSWTTSVIGFKNALSSKFIVIKERTTPVMFIKLKDHLSLKNK